jgi:hypothetical protein
MHMTNLQTAPLRQPQESRARVLIADAFAGTPGRLRLFAAVSVVACLLFGVGGFLIVNRLDSSLGSARAHAAQLVRIQTIRTSLVKADANATNAFLVGGLEPADARAGYVNGIETAAATLAVAANTDTRSAEKLQAVNQVLATYAGLVESARANNRQGFPIGAAYLRQASKSIRDDALPPLAGLVRDERDQVASSANTVADAQRNIMLLLLVVAACLLVIQLWLFRRTHRVLNPSLVLATLAVLVIGLLSLAVMSWSRNRDDKAREGPYAQTVALATARSDGFDAKSSESLTLIARGSGQPFQDRFKIVAADADSALLRVADTDTRNAFNAYLDRHAAVRAADDGGKYDQAVALATGNGAANAAFGNFEATSRAELDRQSGRLSDDLAHARFPLLLLSLLLLVGGALAAVVARRGIAQRLQEYR